MIRNAHGRLHDLAEEEFLSLESDKKHPQMNGNYIRKFNFDAQKRGQTPDYLEELQRFIATNKERVMSLEISDIPPEGEALDIAPLDRKSPRLRFQLIEFKNLRFPLFKLSRSNVAKIESASGSYDLSECYISKMNVIRACDSFHAKGCYIGVLSIDRIVSKLHFEDCYIGDVIIGKDADIRQLTLKNTSIAATEKEDSNFGPLSHLRTLLACLESNSSSDAAHYVRGRLLRAEHIEAHGIMRRVSWFYGAFSDYGLSPGRALSWVPVFFLIVVLVGTCTDGAAVNEAARAELVSGSSSWQDCLEYPWFASGYLAVKTLLNPFSILDSRSLVVPNIWTLVAMFVQAVMNVGLFTVIALSVRRRFKIGS